MTKIARYWVCYDIGDPQRQAAVRRSIRIYSTMGQLSAYECLLNSVNREQLIVQTKALLNATDAFCIIRSLHTYWQNIPRSIPISLADTDYLYIG